jgi:hypothetical protein
MHEIIPEGASLPILGTGSYASRDIGKALVPIAIGSKLVLREECSEARLNDKVGQGSQTANSGTDGQKLDMRLNKPDEQAHHCDVQNPAMDCVY